MTNIHLGNNISPSFCPQRFCFFMVVMMVVLEELRFLFCFVFFRSTTDFLRLIYEEKKQVITPFKCKWRACGERERF